MNENQKDILIKLLGETNLPTKRSFTTPDDQQACMEALVREGLWNEFLIFSSRHRAGFRLTGDSMPSYYTPSFIAWLFRPVNEAGEAHFCALVCSFLEDKHD